ncbi:alpha-(1-_3)-arabinofuranosyltransferase [Skermania sp. ID1734]|uniref:alpha-(1->3)-arabinofuranosyltransferase n=1 Tax=Skermania sp. ID1734 TaxID=2597516 RepID=UPI00351B076C
MLAFGQSPGLIVADTKYDLSQNPIGFLARAAHLWTSQATFGQVQNQAYGYFFPHGAFFALGQVLGVPSWITQRVWWALLLFAGFWGIIRLAEALSIGSRGSRILAAVVFVLSPRVLTTLGSISSETLPMMLAPWVLLPVIRAFAEPERPLRVYAARSAVAVGLMGAVNAVATLAGCLPAVIWWAAHRPNRRWLRFTAWWAPCVLLATAWWLVPLLLLGKVSPPFLDYIESSGVTTQWASLIEVLRGTDSWTPFVSPERIAGAVLVTQPAAVLATGVLAGAGIAGLAMRAMPAKGRLATILFIGLAGLTAGYVGELGSPIADSVRLFLDSGGAPLRNVHKLEPLIRLPLVLGLAHLLARVPLPASVPFRTWRRAFAHPERNPMVAVTGLILVALAMASALAWTGALAPRGAYKQVPQYWQDAANWLHEHANGQRALVVPGAPFGSQVWGLTRDEPLQALASTPWAVRDAIPLNPPGTIRAMDSVQRLFADGRPSAALASTLLQQGIGYLVVRNDLDPETSRSARPMLVHQTLDYSPGLAQVATFGDPIRPRRGDGLVYDSDLRPAYPAIQIYRVGPPDARPSNPYTVPLTSVPVVQGGPESLIQVDPQGPVILSGDASNAGLPLHDLTVTDTPMDRETDFGKVDDHNSALRAPGDPRRTHNLVADYPVYGEHLVEGQWSGGRVSVSSSAADATQLGGTAPGASAAAAVDGDPATAWLSNGLESAVGQWLRIDLDHPISAGTVTVTTSAAAIGTPVKWLEIETANGSAAARITKPGKPVTIALPGGRTGWVRIVAMATEDGSAGSQFGISEVAVTDFSHRDHPAPVPIRFRTVLPPTPPGATVAGWLLAQELPGRPACYDSPDRVRCNNGLALAPEDIGTFQRTLSVPASTSVTPQLTVRPRQGPDLEALLTQPRQPVARGQADVGDPRGSALAATDGDPRTSWTAPQSVVTKPGAALPTLTIELPEPVTVTGLRVTPSKGMLPAHPTEISVNLGDGPQLRKVDAGRITLHPHRTDRIELSLVSWKPVLDQTLLGFTQVDPPGLAEVQVLGPGGKAIGTQSDPNRTVTIDCAHGPVVQLGGRQVHTSVTGTVSQFRSGAPLPARACETPPVPMPAGQVDATVLPGPLFTVDTLRLGAESGPAPPVKTFPGVGVWSEDHRELTVAGSDTERLLTVPQSTNPGWHAVGPDGRSLKAVVVNGWQQGWLLPAGTAGTVTLTYPLDRWYRAGIFGGLVLLLPLALLALVRATGGADADSGPRPWRSRVLGLIGICGVATIISGVAGLVVAVLIAAIAAVWRRPGVLPVVAGAGVVVSAAVLSKGPWRAPDGYLGHSLWAQLPALIAVVAVGVAALPGASVLPRLGPPIRRLLSHRLTARRTGSSTNA